MNCPHCGKEIDNTYTVNVPANVNACNPLPTFQIFNWNANAVAGNGTVMDYTTCAVAAPVPQPIILTLKYEETR